MGLANSLHASAQYSEYNERFDLMNTKTGILVNLVISKGRAPGLYVEQTNIAKVHHFPKVAFHDRECRMSIVNYLQIFFLFL